MKTSEIYEAISFVLFLFLLIIISGCQDDITSTVEISDVNGAIYDANGEPITNANVEIIVNKSFFTTKSLSDGSFHFSNITFPYILNISLSTKSYAYTYNGLTSKTPSIKINNIAQNIQQRRATIHIKTPDTTYMYGNHYLVIAYDSSGTLMSKQSIPLVFNDNANVDWIGGKDSYNINLFIALYCGNGNSYDFRMYTEKQINIKNGGQYSISLNYNDFSYADENKSVTFSFPSEWNMNYSNFAFTCNFMLTSLYKGVNVNYENNQYSLKASFPMIKKKSLFYYYNIDLYSNSNYTSYHWNNITYPGMTKSLTCREIPKIISPINNSEAVDINTVYKINDMDNSVGVYIYEFKCVNPYLFIKLFTNDMIFRFPLFNDTSFALRSDMNYLWNVTKYYNVNSIDEIVSNTQAGNFIPNEYGVSAYSSFKTKK